MDEKDARIAVLEQQLISQQQENEYLSRALIHVRSEKEQFKNETIELRAQLRIASVGKSLINEALQIAREAEQAKSRVRDLEAIIRRYLENARGFYEKSFDETREARKRLESVLEQQGIRPLTAIIYNSANLLLNTHSQFLQGQVKDATNNLGQPDISYEDFTDPSQYPENALVMAWSYIYAGEVQLTAIAALEHSLIAAQDPVLIAWKIMDECRENEGTPNPKTVESLPLPWILRFLPDPPTTHQKLCKGLAWAYRHKMSSNSIEIFADFNATDLSEKTLRRYIGWYQALEGTLNVEIPKITGKLPDIRTHKH